MLTDLTYLAYPLPEDIERLVYTGDLSRALRVIEMRLANDKVPQALKNRLRFEERIIREIPLSYNVSEGEMLVQLQSAFRDFTKEDMERLRDEGTLDWVMIDGSVFYKDNALSSAVKTRPDLHARLLDPHALDESNANAQLLDDVWGWDTDSSESTVNVHINRLRTRFADWGDFEIQTVRGLGYRAVVNESE